MTKQNLKRLSIKKKDVQLFRFMFSVKEGESRFSVVWYQTVNSVGTIGGIGSFSQQNSSLADKKRTRSSRRTHGAGMKKRILDLNQKYNAKRLIKQKEKRCYMMATNGSKNKFIYSNHNV